MRHKLETRFVGILEFKAELTQELWQKGIAGNRIAWLDTTTGIIWGKSLEKKLDRWDYEKNIELAQQLCHQQIPIGYWALPTSAEFILGRNHQMEKYIDNISGLWITQIFAIDVLMIPPGSPSLFILKKQNANVILDQKIASVRCVARSQKAPKHGYIRDDLTYADADPVWLVK